MKIVCRYLLLYCALFLAIVVARADSGFRSCHEAWNPESFESSFVHAYGYPSTFADEFHLMEQGQFRKAADALTHYNSEADIFFSDYDDLPHHFRSTERLHMLAFCQMKLGHSDQARQTLKKMFESQENPPYVWGEKALNLLVYLEPSTDLPKFLDWAKAHKVDYHWSRFTCSPNLEQMIAIRQDIEADRYESALKPLSEYPLDRSYGLNIEPQAHLIIRWLLDHPKSLLYLLDELKKGRGHVKSCVVFAVGEFFDASATPVLLTVNQRSDYGGQTSSEICLALAKSGYKGAIRWMYNMGVDAHNDNRTVANCLLCRLTGVSFGALIKGDMDDHVWNQWKAWIVDHLKINLDATAEQQSSESALPTIGVP